MYTVTSQDLTIIGGIAPALDEKRGQGQYGKTENELSALSLGLKWVIIEKSDECVIVEVTDIQNNVVRIPISDLTICLPLAAEDLAFIERIRFFGPGGDLEFRRNCKVFHWRLIGPKNCPLAAAAGSDFWQKSGLKKLVKHEETFILWGEWRGDKFVEDKVAAAKLNYPVTGKRAIIKTESFTYYGRSQFSWYKSLEGLS